MWGFQERYRGLGWSLPVISLTCIAIALPNIRMDEVDNLLKCVAEGLLCTHIVEGSLNKASEYVNIQRASATLWDDVEANYK
ncbi:hypothetical protein L1987_77047 [Smallanthus sonchifolius]|uniref:Uncharacterized protein n=1 Tax=Smallanthus sonchifolius TaxID=185202 RepID=A0ACB8Z942_9ASTR|nr:hypothetical protein L1987_77047 [Smallanthus sonchifolius]